MDELFSFVIIYSRYYLINIMFFVHVLTVDALAVKCAKMRPSASSRPSVCPVHIKQVENSYKRISVKFNIESLLQFHDTLHRRLKI